MRRHAREQLPSDSSTVSSARDQRDHRAETEASRELVLFHLFTCIHSAVIIKDTEH